MAEPAAVRVRRHRLHRKGDHSECVTGRCEAKGGTIRTQPPVPAIPTETPQQTDGERVVGRIEQMAAAFVATLPYGDGDPRRMVAALAVELARRVDETGAAPAAIRELRVMLNQLAEAPNGPSGVVDELRLSHHQRQLDAILATALAA